MSSLTDRQTFDFPEDGLARGGGWQTDRHGTERQTFDFPEDWLAEWDRWTDV